MRFKIPSAIAVLSLTFSSFAWGPMCSMPPDSLISNCIALSTPIGTNFTQPLAVLMVDSAGQPLANFPVTFTVLSSVSGASAALSENITANGVSNMVVTTDAQGIAKVFAKANSTAGSYMVLAAPCITDAMGADDPDLCGLEPTEFTLTNTAR